jgi:hypothetical protein
MRRSVVVPTVIATFVIVMVVIGAFIYWKPETNRILAVSRVLNQPSEIYADMLVQYDKPPIYQEEYSLQDVQGVSKYAYRIEGFSGQEYRVVNPPYATTDVSFFWGKVVLDGVWSLVNKPPRGNTNAHYTIFVKQYADFKHGERRITFTDPHYWATTAGRQYSIDLRKTNPGDLLKLQSTQLADPHYDQVVDDFRTFGPEVFKRNVAAVRAKIEHQAAR